ncbi:MAG: GNAT family N-acetyltransferase [Candidatus Aenigmarchaeota archaeon]|nr:GNAT family N-acetyltransferase [Candidatus Aenigmarchaeota archaeon]
MEIRKATAGDLEQLALLNQNLVLEHVEIDNYYSTVDNADSLWREDIEKHLNDPESGLFVAEENKKIIGYIMGSIRERYKIFSARRYAEIWSSFVDKEFRHQGAMKELFSCFREWAKENGVELIELHTDLRNKEVFEAWKSLGFEHIRAQMRMSV